jgi:hypothetical protein
MDIKYEIEPVFKIEFFKIECIDFKNKKKKLEKVLERYPEMPQTNFASNRNKCSINTEFREIFKDEFSLIRAKFNSKILLQRVWSVVYNPYSEPNKIKFKKRILSFDFVLEPVLF